MRAEPANIASPQIVDAVDDDIHLRSEHLQRKHANVVLDLAADPSRIDQDYPWLPGVVTQSVVQ